MAGRERTGGELETAAHGAGGGVEAEAVTGAADGGATPLDPERIEIQTRAMTVAQLLSRIDAGTLDLLPELMQRRDGWSAMRESRLVESLLLKIPLPPLYAVEDATEGWTIVDGMRRLAAVARFVNAAAIGQRPLALQGLEYLRDDFEGATYDKLPPRMQRRLGETDLIIHVIRHATPERSKFNIARRVGAGGTTLSDQELRHALIAGPARELLRDLAESNEFRKATANSVGDEGMADRELVLRFLAFRLTPWQDYDSADLDSFLGAAMRRLNELDDAPPERREAAEPVEPESPEAATPAGPPPDRPVTAEDGPPDAPTEPSATLKTDAESQSEPAPEPEPEPAPEPEPEPITRAGLAHEFRAAMTTAAAIFGDDAFRRPNAADEPRNPVNAALFEAVAVALAGADEATRTALAAQGASIKKDFIDLVQNSGFANAISQDTGDPAQVRKRFREIDKMFEKARSCSSPSG